MSNNYKVAEDFRVNTILNFIQFIPNELRSDFRLAVGELQACYAASRNKTVEAGRKHDRVLRIIQKYQDELDKETQETEIANAD